MIPLRYGPNALLVECADLDEVAALHAELVRRAAQGALPPVRDLVPAERTVLIDGLDDPASLAAELVSWTLPPMRAACGRTVELTVHYDGPDLEEVADAWGVSTDDVAAIHSAHEYRVAFCGFAPGFAYLTGLPERYQLPRRPTPRASVPPGFVAVAGPYTGVYPSASPGGWNLIGATDAQLWDLDRDEPALLVPGSVVRFVPTSRRRMRQQSSLSGSAGQVEPQLSSSAGQAPLSASAGQQPQLSTSAGQVEPQLSSSAGQGGLSASAGQTGLSASAGQVGVSGSAGQQPQLSSPAGQTGLSTSAGQVGVSGSAGQQPQLSTSAGQVEPQPSSSAGQALPAAVPVPASASAAIATERAPAVEILRAGALTTIQDLGRPGFAHLGVPRSGALDGTAHRLANRLVGNEAGAATLETTVNGLTLRALVPTVVAVCGAVAPIRVDGRPAPWSAPIELRPGQTLDVGTATQGVRNYIAFAGGVAVDSVLGSRSADLLSGLGTGPGARNSNAGHSNASERNASERNGSDRNTAARSRDNQLRDGDLLPLGIPIGPPQYADTHPVSVAAPQPTGSAIELPVLPGPRPAAFPQLAWQTLTGSEYTVSPASNRIALRLEGPSLARTGPDTIPSEGTVLGAIQVPADGLPIIFLADHPPTGGYPVIGVVPAAALSPAAQAPPGTRIRFR